MGLLWVYDGFTLGLLWVCDGLTSGFPCLEWICRPSARFRPGGRDARDARWSVASRCLAQRIGSLVI
eukprot:7259487-Lingulodinium_polyedra.AAC.1